MQDMDTGRRLMQDTSNVAAEVASRYTIWTEPCGYIALKEFGCT